MTPSFESYVAVDWSGAKGEAYSGIAVAECRNGSDAPILIAPPKRRWSRSDFVEWLISRASEGQRSLVGIDCAFTLPAATSEIVLGGCDSAFALWDHLDRVCVEAKDYYGGGFADHQAHAPLFWRAGPRPAEFAEHHRATEHACRVAGLGAPESPLKLVGARQVGKGGLAGMRALAAVKRRIGDAFGVWPFESADAARIVAVELYPRLFLRMAGHGNGKVRTLLELDRCLDALGSAPYDGVEDRLSDHDTDALVAAAGLRHIAGEAAVWNPAGLDALARRAEGWIFGVP